MDDWQVRLTTSSFLPATVLMTATRPSEALEVPLDPPARHPIQAQHRAQATLDQTPLICLPATATVIQAASGHKATSLCPVLAINPSLKQTVSHMRRLSQSKASTLRFPLHPTALPLSYIFPWRARNWFMAIDQNGDGELSHDELCMFSFQDPLPSSAQIILQAARS
jgi:hypothetical protein